MVTALSDAQLDSLGPLIHREVWLSGELPDAARARHALRLYAALTPGQRQALWEGAALPVAQMTPRQRALFLTALERQKPSRSRSLAQVAAGSFRLRQTPRVRIHEQRGGVTFERTEDAAPAAGTVGGAAAPRAEMPERAGPTPEAVAYYPLTRLEFQFQFGPEAPESVSITVSSP